MRSSAKVAHSAGRAGAAERTSVERSGTCAGAARRAALMAGGLTIGLALGLSLGCGQLLGLNEYEASGSGGSGASGGHGGSAGVSGAAGTGGAEPSCDRVPRPNQDIIRSCLLRTACTPGGPSTSMSQCVSLNYQDAFPGAACTLGATDCRRIEVCQGTGFTTAAQCDGQPAVRCDDANNVGYDCEAGRFVNCRKLGGTCTVYDREGGVANAVGCKVTDCTLQEGWVGCDGDWSYTCYSGQGIGLSCQSLTATCQTPPPPLLPGCFHDTAPCEGNSGSCDGDVARQCSGGSLLVFNCGSVGLGCATDGTEARCVAPGCTLEQEESCEESCDGATLSFCYGGVKFPLDCQEHGYSRCEMLEPTPQTPEPRATCR